MRDDVARIVSPDARVDRIVMIYGGQPNALWNILNVKAAIGGASALRLFLDDADLGVAFHTFANPPGNRTPRTQSLIYTDLGECYTVDEVRDRRYESEPGE